MSILSLYTPARSLIDNLLNRTRYHKMKLKISDHSLLKPYKPIIIMSTQRSGSTMVCKDLKQTGVLGNPGEHFLSWCQKFENRHLLDWSIELSNVLKKSSTQNGVSCIKVMANYVARIGSIFLDIQSFQSKNSIDTFFEDYKGCVWIRVYRQDKIRQAISRVIARKTKVYHSFSDKLTEDYSQKLTYNFNDIQEEIINIQNEEKVWDSFIDKNSINPYLIIYEDVIDNTDYINDLLGKLNLENIKNNISRKTRRLSNKVNEHWYEKYHSEVCGVSDLVSDLVMGNQLLRSGKLEEAVDAYQKAIAHHPAFHWSHYKLGEALEKLGRLEEAAEAYRQAMKLKNRDSSS